MAGTGSEIGRASNFQKNGHIRGAETFSALRGVV